MVWKPLLQHFGAELALKNNNKERIQMSNWETTFGIGDRVAVEIAHTTRDQKTHRIVVQHLQTQGEVETINLNGETLGVRFPDGHVREYANRVVWKV
jgi:hypothetical protein